MIQDEVSHWFYITPDEYVIAEKIGIDAANLERRIRQFGWSKERALTEPIREKRDRSYWSEIAEQNGIKYKTFISRILYFGMSEEEAATKPLQDKQESVRRMREIRRVIPANWVKVAEKNGIAYPTLRARLRKGMDPVKAMTKPVMSHKDAGSMGAEARRNSADKYLFR